MRRFRPGGERPGGYASLICTASHRTWNRNAVIKLNATCLEHGRVKAFSLPSPRPQEGNVLVMNSIIYLVGLIVVVLVILSLLGLA